MVGKEEVTDGFHSEKPVFAKLNLGAPTRASGSPERQGGLLEVMGSAMLGA